MEIVEDRHGRSSTLIASQLPLKAWHDLIGDPTFADAILDRLVHNAYRLDLEGPRSMRELDHELTPAMSSGKSTKGGQK
jgi:DNA replication protein DnaC